MDIFKIHSQVIDQYSKYIFSFLDIADDRIREKVNNYFSSHSPWPKPLIQFNPSFEISGSIDEIISKEVVDENLRYVFDGYKLYKHQIDALKLGTSGKHFIVTSGTGSGKSLTYIGTIFDYLFKLKSKPKGIKALIVYPMNALINSQTLEITKYKDRYEEKTGKAFPISFRQYTGQESDIEKQEVKDELPDILLTNYMMLELIMTRLGESGIRNSINENLKFLVFDELHTYRGRQGADVSLLIRRIHSNTKNALVCIGTSATMASGSDVSKQREEVAEVGRKIFGVDLKSDQVVNETIISSLSSPNEDIPITELNKELQAGFDTVNNKKQLVELKLAKWIEKNVAIEILNGEIYRRKPTTKEEIAKTLSEQTKLEENLCKNRLEEFLTLVNKVNKQEDKTDTSILPFKVHQFIAQTGSVYVTIESPEKRFITLDSSAYIADEAEGKKPLFQLAFSRNSGYEFLCVRRNQKDNKLEPREFTQRIAEEEDDDENLGYIVFDKEKDQPIWTTEDLVNLPDAWIRVRPNGEITIKSEYVNQLPHKIYFDEYGNYSEAKGNLPFEGWYISAPLLFDSTSGTFFDRKTAEGTKLSKLGTEGRSTSTTILSFSTIKALDSEELDYKEQKLLSFTDNRQDAALQAGHFNDFYKIGKIRSSIYYAVRDSNSKSLDHTNIADAVFNSLNISQEIFAKNPSDLPFQREENERVFKDYLFYRIILDLKRGWRVSLPNLEQSGLIKISYKYLSETIDNPAFYSKSSFLALLYPEQRKDFVLQTHEYLRKNYAINHTILDDNELIRRSHQIREEIKSEWGLDDKEQIDIPYYVRVESIDNTPKRMYTTSLGSRSYFGKYLRATAKNINLKIDADNYSVIVYELLDALENAKWVSSKEVSNNGNRIKVYRLELKSIIWELGDEKNMIPDKVRFQSYKEHKTSINEYFKNYYKQNFSKLKYIEAKEHTAQINNEDRKIREKEFREGKISVLNCSPTMELGIDISTLNVVHLRNVPPNPSNYAQRSGRAGRSGQAALILTYCSNYSPHDRHYFSDPSAMVSGIVSPPNVDLINEELLISHLNAIYLSEVGLGSLDHSISELIDLDKYPDLPLKNEVKEKLKLPKHRKNAVAVTFKGVVQDIEDKLKFQKWYNDDWIDRQINFADVKFDEALDRWRELYRSAQKQLQKSTEIIQSTLYTNDSPEKRLAYIEQKQANKQLDLLRNEDKSSNKNFSEFYPYRYLASEGFLPGYNFSRLPIRVFIPKGDEGEFISRPRFLALREFGPNNTIYHDGSRYKVNQTILNDAENKITKMKVSKNSGYALIKDEYNNNYCPFTETYLKTDNEREIYEDLLPMAESKTMQIERISCEEEERLALGYDIRTYITVEGGLDRMKTVKIKDGKDDLLKIRYIPTATLIKVSEKWRARRDTGFLVNIKTGFWKSERDLEKEDQKKDIRRVRLFTTDTSDALYIHPMKALAFKEGKESEAIITFIFALKRAIENVFQVESVEIGAEVMGKGDWPNVLIYESAEGSLGILSQLVEDINLFKKVVNEAYSVCYFKDREDTRKDLGPATYNDLLSYYNQRHHLEIDRHLIKEALEKLMNCELEILGNAEYKDYDEQFKSLMERIDPTSSTEKKFLEFLYKNNLKLPDFAQYSVGDIYVKPDFFYKKGNVCVFCDGTPHDDPVIKEQDREKRKALENKGYDVFVYYYENSLEEIIKKRSDIFSKVR